MRTRAVAALIVVAAAVAAAGCGGRQPFRIGLLVDCGSILGQDREVTQAAAELPLLDHGAKPVGRKPSQGVRDAAVAGRPVEVVTGCADWTSLRTTIEQGRWLVEKKGANVVIGPFYGASDAFLIRDLAKLYPNVAFVLGVSPAQEVTLRDPPRNLFRFSPDGAQLAAGLGAYAYRTLGWRRAAVVEASFAPLWPEAAGFVAEFCSLGGRVERITTPPWSSLTGGLAKQVWQRADGVMLVAPNIGDTLNFVAGYAGVRPDLARHLLLGPGAYAFADSKMLTQSMPLLRGVTGGDGSPHDVRAPGWVRFRHELDLHFPGLLPPGATPADFPLVLAFYNDVSAVVVGLERAHGAQTGSSRPCRTCSSTRRPGRFASTTTGRPSSTST